MVATNNTVLTHSSGDWKMRKQQGFTLIELMIVVAIIGILAAIAIPAYQDYTVRSKMSEVVLATASPRTAVTETYQSEGAMPANQAAAGLGLPADFASRYVTSVTYALTSSDRSTITALATADVGGGVDATQGVLLTGIGTPATGQVEWTCSPVGIAVKYLPSTCRGAAPAAGP
jgi:type IV pilus assembly protein PilA